MIHPLWLLSRQTDHRRDEIRAGAAGVVAAAIEHWVDGEGFAWETGDDAGLQGTEMWLSIIYIASDLLGESAGLSWRPRGVHRLKPASPLPSAGPIGRMRELVSGSKAGPRAPHHGSSTSN